MSPDFLKEKCYMAKPLLSIGIIFKNEIRCLERCLKSLQPLRDAVPSELVMADTGATDGSRAVAEQYADILIDFEWINDFAAARNAVMNQCSGKWYLSIDCDEWLGGDISKLVAFLKGEEEGTCYGAVVIRNYTTPGLEKDGEYSDFDAIRILRMSTGLRFEGAIHEHWPPYQGKQEVRLFSDVLFHHDGYMYIDPTLSKQKHERNMTLLRKKLEDNPGDLTTLLQCIESTEGDLEAKNYIEQGIQRVKEKAEGWNVLGGAILRYAVLSDYRKGSSQLDEHIKLAEEMFPNSIYTQVDVNFVAFGQNWKEKNYKECILRGESYLKGLAQYTSGSYSRIETMCSTLMLSSNSWKTQIQLFLAGSYLYEGQPEKGFKILTELDGTQMTVGNVNNAVQIYAHFHSRSMIDTDSIVKKLWEQITSPVPNEDRAVQRRNEMIRVAADFFGRRYQESEAALDSFCRHAFAMFLPVAGDCVLGDAAEIMTEQNVFKLEQQLSKVEDWDVMPISALAHALKMGAAFPPANKPLKMEELDILAGRLANDSECIHILIDRLPEDLPQMGMRDLDWTRSLIMAAIRSVSDWKVEGESEWNMGVARKFARIEKMFLPRCYSAEVLSVENIDIIPPMHRFGWYFVQAFGALDAGDTLGYVRLLRAGLEACNEMKAMVEFLIDNTPQLAPQPSDELTALADRVRLLLSQYAPDDPAVAALKQSEAYKRVEYLIEGMPAPVWGKLPQ